ncbi:hypothetical protein LC040_11040 [Bacillus tianshenii]|nr:hypothetical protein LC040_11040 [Bacillus tianshenii]
MKSYKNCDVTIHVSGDGLVNRLEAFERRFEAERGILHIGSSTETTFETVNTIHAGLPLFERRVDLFNNTEKAKPFEIWFHQNFKEQTDEQIGFYSPCEQSFIHYVDGVYFLFGLHAKTADKSIRYALSNDARPSYYQLRNAPDEACWRPLASGRVDSTLCVEGMLAPYERDSVYFHMIAARSEKELFEYHHVFQQLDSIHSMHEALQHDSNTQISYKNQMETQSC